MSDSTPRTKSTWLTLEEELMVYKISLTTIKYLIEHYGTLHDEIVYIMFHIARLHFRIPLSVSVYQFPEIFPKLWNNRPANCDFCMWFSMDNIGNQKRIKFIENLIKEMEHDLYGVSSG